MERVDVAETDHDLVGVVEVGVWLSMVYGGSGRVIGMMVNVVGRIRKGLIAC